MVLSTNIPNFDKLKIFNLVKLCSYTELSAHGQSLIPQRYIKFWPLYQATYNLSCGAHKWAQLFVCVTPSSQITTPANNIVGFL